MELVSHLDTILVTGCGGLIGSEALSQFAKEGFRVVGVDNDMRKDFFGQEASTRQNLQRIKKQVKNVTLINQDLRDRHAVTNILRQVSPNLKAVIHCAAQPSHDFSANDPILDFDTNARATLLLLEAVRKHAPESSFVFMSSNKVYGDRPNQIEFKEAALRWEPKDGERWANGIDESMSIDQSTHSVFGVSKSAADLMVQEYGRNFGLKTVCFRGGCLTGPRHAGVEMHGFLSYLVKCGVRNQPYRIFGYKGKQVRDNIHAYDVVTAIKSFINRPGVGKTYNLGGGPTSNCSILEAMKVIESLTGKEFRFEIQPLARVGDHIWYVSDMRKFQLDYPEWRPSYSLDAIIDEMVQVEKLNFGSGD